jgi:UDP-GlcNAc:undecaprenyl-phosphate GlcNAc-1-phosphate transferase
VLRLALVLLLPWALATVLTPLMARVARARGWLDHPRGRHQHEQPTPLVGGVPVFLSVGLGLALASIWVPQVRDSAFGSGSLLAFGVVVVPVLALGLWDDFKDLPAGPRLAAQVGLACLAWAVGFRCGSLELPFGWALEGEVASLLLTVVWLVLVTNAFNFLDGIDGLTTGIAIPPALMLYLLAEAHGAGHASAGLAALALTGSLAGFLRFNLPPARIYLGDAGALSIGFSIGLISLASFEKSPTAFALSVPMLIVGLPVVDAVTQAVRRILSNARREGVRGLTPLSAARAAFRGDRGHLHYVLMRAGLSVPQVLLVLYLASVILVTLGMSLREATSELRWGMLGVVLMGGYVSIRVLDRWVSTRERRARREALEREQAQDEQAQPAERRSA